VIPRTMNMFTRSLGALAIATLTACSDSATAPTAALANADLGSCSNLQTPTASTLTARLYAKGVQIYRWNDTSWVFVSPSAVLTSDPEGTATVAIHYSGPTWEGIDGSKVVGTGVGTCKPNANAIPWLLLSGASAGLPGVFRDAKFIQRLNTTGGLAPTTPGNSGDIISVPYTAQYYFYRAP
jgi:hypothetical protein